jgi:hypothetical protein
VVSLGLRGLRSFGDHGEYGSCRDRSYDIDNDGLRGSVGSDDLCDDFSLS